MIFGKETHFKETKIGRFPSDWQDAKLEDVLSLLRNGIVASQNKEGRGFPITRIETISDEKIDSNRFGYLDKANGFNYGDFFLVDGDILFSHINSLEHIGKSALYEGVPESLLHGMNLLLLRPKTDVVNPKYLLYLLKLLKKRNLFKAIAKKAVNQASINQTELGRIRIPIPSMFEQQGIVDVLSCVDLSIQKTDEVIAKTELLKKGLMQKLLTEGIGHKEFKDTEIGKIPEEWQVLKLRDVCHKIQDGTHFSPKPQPTGVPYITSKNIRSWGIDLTDAIYVAPKDHLEIFKRCDPKLGDLLYVKDGVNTGTVTVNTLAYEFTLLSSVAMIRPNPDFLEPWFLKYALDSPNLKKRHLGVMTGTAIRRLTLDRIRSLKVPVPNMVEQRKISEILSTMDTKLRHENKKKAKLQRIKQGLMDLLLSGKVRVKVDYDALQ